jgi:hypothetical protein
MLSWLIKKSLAAFERRWNYDTAYARDVVDKAGPGAVLPMNGLQKLAGYRRDIPADVYYVGTLVAGKAADCGPCLQLGVTMATAAGVAASTIRAALSDDRDALPEHTHAAYDLAKAVIARDGSGDAAREEIVRRYGWRALMSLAYGMVVAEAYPTIKYVIGYGHACVRVKIAGEDVALGHPAAV